MSTNKKKYLAVVVALVLVGVFVLAKHSRPALVPQGSLTSPEIISNHISVNGVTTWTLRQSINTATTTLCSFAQPAGTATSTSAAGVSFLGALPGMGTSTLQSISVQITTGTSTAATFDIATSTQPYATSTPSLIYAVSVASGAQFGGNWTTENTATSSDVRLWSSMATNGGNRNEIGPAQFVNVTTVKPASGAASSGYTYGGQCIAVFRSLSAI